MRSPRRIRCSIFIALERNGEKGRKSERKKENAGEEEGEEKEPSRLTVCENSERESNSPSVPSKSTIHVPHRFGKQDRHARSRRSIVLSRLQSLAREKSGNDCIPGLDSTIWPCDISSRTRPEYDRQTPPRSRRRRGSIDFSRNIAR